MATIPLAQLPNALKLVDRRLRRFGVELLKIFTRTLAEDLPQVPSPVGDPATDPHPGKYLASHKVSIRSPQFAQLPDRPSYDVPRGAKADAELVGLRQGMPTFITNDARSDGSHKSYAPALEDGWSKQAPGGVYRVALDWLRAKSVQLAILAARAVVRGGPVVRGGR